MKGGDPHLCPMAILHTGVLTMYIKKLQIKNFKSFQDICIEFNKDVNIFTGVNNAGKTTMLEALALWHECFSKLIQEAKKGTKNYAKGDYVLGNTQHKYFPYDQINSVRAPNFEDIFYRLDKRIKIELHATFENSVNETLTISFEIGQSGLNYVIVLMSSTSYDYKKFNHFFKNLPNPIGLYYASPVSAIGQKEKFVTIPQIQNAILNRQSARVFRNRLYHLYNGLSFNEFIEDLSYILFENQHKIEISLSGHPNKNIYVIFNFKIGSKDIEKEISLLGSGTLQIMEILLNFYYSDDSNRDINLVLLDEPDSHIHRDIQHRLLKTLTKFTKNTQVFLSTHNEALIRNATIDYLFHLEAKPVNHYKSLGNQDIEKQKPRFSGIYPSVTNPIISSLGHSNGLDFINAIEADRLIFVEGEDDARIIDILLKKGQINNRSHYVYWVLGGVSKIFTEITHYETVFSAIKNEKTLWEKSVLIFDRDYLDDNLLNKLSERLNKKLKSHTWLSYTFESTLFSDLEKLAKLLANWLKSGNYNPDKDDIRECLIREYESMQTILENRYDDKFYESIAHTHDSIKTRANNIFEKPLNINAQQLNTNIRNHIKSCFENKEFYKLMNKDDVSDIINCIASSYEFSFDIETDMVSLIQCVDKSTWLDNWDFLNSI